jgi:hypothetical protein
VYQIFEIGAWSSQTPCPALDVGGVFLVQPIQRLRPAVGLFRIGE